MIFVEGNNETVAHSLKTFLEAVLVCQFAQNCGRIKMLGINKNGEYF